MYRPVHLEKDHLRYVAAVADEAVSSGIHTCAVVSVANRHQTLWTHVVSGKDTVSLDTVFLLASISKPITAVAVARLVEQGKLLLHRPVVEYLPEFTGGGKEKITAFHLLTHTNGLDEARWAQARFAGQSDVGTCFEEACRTTLLFDPGSRIQYGTLSFAVLGELITRLGGQPYPDYLHTQIFHPLGMENTGFIPNPQRRAPVHGLGEATNVDELIKRAMPGGGLWSTAADLTVLGQTLLNGGKHGSYHVIGPAALEAMTRVQKSGDTDWGDGRMVPFHYGLGWGKGSNGEGTLGSLRAYDHGGATGTLLCIDPDWDLIFVYLTNTWGDASEAARRTLNAVYGALTVE